MILPLGIYSKIGSTPYAGVWHSSFLPFEYNIFRSHAEQQLCRTLELRYGNSLTTYAWDVFNMKEKTIALKPKIPTFIAKLLLYSFVAFSAYQIV